MPYTPTFEADKDIQKAIDDCLECQRLCLETASYWYITGEEIRDIDVWLLLDCSDICEISAKFMMRDSEFVNDVLENCIAICDRTAENLELLGEGADGIIRKCIASCRKCAESCRKVSSIKEEKPI
ncbi:four-helix bundle copper-binding protein [Patescibacteria group bacterium]|nr:four-helix bundle copper-binding protein [Patescibacteria group bacterium]